MVFVLVVLGVALAVSLAFNFGLLGGTRSTSVSAPSSSGQNVARSDRRDDDAGARASKLESDLEKKRKELEELKKTHGELKDELKTAKKKLHDQKEAEKTDGDLVKARHEVERQASVQLDATRSELATALSEVQRLKAEIENKGRKPKAEAAPAEQKEERREPQQVTRVIRELSEAEKEKMQRLEQQSASDKKKAIEIAAELRNIKSKVDREKREAKRIYEEGRLARDKFRAVETRLNRTLLENDMLKRAIADLEKKTGTHAEHATPTADEFAQADARMKAKHEAEDNAADEARQKLEAAEATTGADAAESNVAVATSTEQTPVPSPTPSAPQA